MLTYMKKHVQYFHFSCSIVSNLKRFKYMQLNAVNWKAVFDICEIAEKKSFWFWLKSHFWLVPMTPYYLSGDKAELSTF